LVVDDVLDEPVTLVHNPAHDLGLTRVVFCGHVHEKWLTQDLGGGRIAINVGVNHWGFAPVAVNGLVSLAHPHP